MAPFINFQDVFPFNCCLLRRRKIQEREPLLSEEVCSENAEPQLLLSRAQFTLRQAESYLAWLLGMRRIYYSEAAELYTKAGRILRIRGEEYCRTQSPYQLYKQTC